MKIFSLPLKLWPLLLPACALAHETWLFPSSYKIEPGHPVTLSLTSGMNFPAPDYAIVPDRVSTANYRAGAEVKALPKPTRGKSSLDFPVSLQNPGLIAIWTTLHPKTLELSPAKVTEYFEEINASAEIRSLWASFKGQRQWRETYTKCAKTYLTVGNQTISANSWKNAVGLPFELIPIDDPTKALVTGTFSLILQTKDSLLAGRSIGLIQNGSRTFQLTDTEGRASFNLTKPGPALFFAVELTWQGEEWKSYFTTMTITVAN